MEEYQDQDDQEEIDDQELNWIQWFCQLDDHQYLVEIDEEYIKDSFNLYGIKQKFNYYNEALQQILSDQSPSEQELKDDRYIEIYQEATDIYGLIHSRFITTSKGLAMMREKYLLGHFGVCPRVLCERQNVIPLGMSQELRTSRVKIFCPKCEDIYIPKQKCSYIDGCYFGCSFPSLLLITYPDLLQQKNNATYIPRIYGFRVYQKKGSRFKEDKQQEVQEISYYTEQYLKKVNPNNQKQDKDQNQNQQEQQQYNNNIQDQDQNQINQQEQQQM